MHDVPDQTSGSPVREARPLMERLLVFDLDREIERLRQEPTFADDGRNSMTLAKETDLRVLLTVLRAGSALKELDGEGRMSVQVLEGTVRLDVEGEPRQLGGRQLATVDADTRWRLSADADAVVLITMTAPDRENLEGRT